MLMVKVISSNSIVSICSPFVVQLVPTLHCATVGKILTDTSRRAVRLR